MPHVSQFAKCQRTPMTRFLFVLCALCSLTFANPSQAQRSRLENQHAIAALKFEQLAINGHHRYKLQSVLAWLDLASTSPDYFDKAQQTIDSLLVRLEPEDSLYFPTQLVRAWVKHKKGETQEARQILDQAANHLTMADHPLYLWMQFHVFIDEDIEKSDLARQTLLKKYPQSPEAHALISLGASSIGVKKSTQSAPAKKENETTVKEFAFHLQLGAFSSETNAQKALNDIGSLPEGYQLFILKDESRNLFLLRLKGFDTKEKAHLFAQEELRLERGQYLVLFVQ